ncbi:pantetheine-phosphate adenylyltransferase [Mycoplasmopsis caviae]|uniref:Phosphopantetheine adenylyltransferase n=1 Tax=Mycoplasmopsis caviae TaxID=55603 RepID=A0A3P8LI93_9BACT|nr:pantetheine-phosphate adenylyltransferase [Mycoplasmopsis caviae]UUD35052.1 pantetheine-phosphate adenylyltransferase [Mycoplasmopsis caviae]VDR42122.1 pantetheine-phosphate adenylyltransferase [Mycoplasmopsis caviae]
MHKVAIYPGSFDPLHKGHISVVEKALKLFDNLIVIVSINPDKDNLENLDIRFNNVKNSLKDYKTVIVVKNENNLIAQIAKDYGANFIVRSARNNLDYNYELVLAAANNSLNKDLETILILPDYENIDYSSTLLRHKQKLGKK